MAQRWHSAPLQESGSTTSTMPCLGDGSIHLWHTPPDLSLRETVRSLKSRDPSPVTMTTHSKWSYFYSEVKTVNEEMTSPYYLGLMRS